MATIKRNLEIWDSTQHWEHGVFGDGVGLDDGEKWSRNWGSSYRQWLVTIEPRIRAYLSGGDMLELGPGRGRWTFFLKNYARELMIVDISSNCIEYCQQRFSGDRNIKYIVNDGRSLTGVSQNEIDFIFSFDSLVHVDIDDMEAYISEFARTLAPGGHAFIHHSNLGQYKQGISSNPHMRSSNVSGEDVEKLARGYGMSTISQEFIPWSADNLSEAVFLDAFSLLVKRKHQVETTRLYNSEFLIEQKKARELSL